MNGYVEALRKYAVFAGRSRRREYWMFTLVHLLVTLTLYSVTLNTGRAGLTVYAAYVCVLFPPGLAVTVRRLHDTGRSGWWVLASFIPFLGTVLMVWFLVTPGQPGANVYGPDPKDPENL